MDIAQHEVDYLAQSYRHGFRYRIGEMTGSTASVGGAGRSTTTRKTRIVTPQRVFPYDTFVMSIGSLSNDFGTPGGASML